MRKFIQQKLKEQKGLTLIELLAVIVILAIIAAIAIPAISGIIQNSRVGAVKSDALNVINAAQMYKASDNITTGTITVSELEAKNFLDDLNSFETNKTTSSVDLSTMTLTGIGSLNSGAIQVQFKGASKEEISNVDNSSPEVTAASIASGAAGVIAR